MAPRIFKRAQVILIAALKFLIHGIGFLFVKPLIIFSRDEIPSNEAKHKILYVTLAFRGDFILNLPTINALKENFPNSHLTVWVRDYNIPLAKITPSINEAISYEQPYGKPLKDFIDLIFRGVHSSFLEKIRDFDIYIDDTGYVFTSLIGFLAHIKFRIGRNFQGFGFLNLYELFYEPNTQLIERRLKLLKPFGVNLTIKDIKAPYINIDKITIEKVIDSVGVRGKDYFTIQPFAGWKAKDWGISNFVFLAEQLAQVSGLTPVFIGSEIEKSQIEEALLKTNIAAVNSAGKLNIFDSAALIAGSRLHLGGDSVGAHLAAALGIKSLTIFGPTNAIISAYLGKNNIAVLKRTKCSPKEGKIYCCPDAGRSCPHISCMTELKREDVQHVLNNLWAGEKLPKVVEF